MLTLHCILPPTILSCAGHRGSPGVRQQGGLAGAAAQAGGDRPYRGRQEHPLRGPQCRVSSNAETSGPFLPVCIYIAATPTAFFLLILVLWIVHMQGDDDEEEAELASSRSLVAQLPGEPLFLTPAVYWLQV